MGPGGEARMTIEDGSAEAGLTAILPGSAAVLWRACRRAHEARLMIHDPRRSMIASPTTLSPRTISTRSASATSMSAAIAA
jgi:hypothetical protein